MSIYTPCLYPNLTTIGHSIVPICELEMVFILQNISWNIYTFTTCVRLKSHLK